MTSPEQLANRVDSRDTFTEFLAALRSELSLVERRETESPVGKWTTGHLGWENPTLDRFLEAMHAWAVDASLPEQPSWALIAQLLVAGKMYE